MRTRWNKQGFRPPQEDWIRGPLLNWVEEMIVSRSFIERGLWNVSWWRQVMRRLRGGELPLAWDIWRPAICEAWYQYFVDRASEMPQLSVFAYSDK